MVARDQEVCVRAEAALPEGGPLVRTFEKSRYCTTERATCSALAVQKRD
ncbi:hypothetical protein SAMN00790413_05121 [Deinococcus hopiensis KR-140]|uniref:Uncharacterized protein n=1 Tax=Deinococcus hopiensis KR-140 TaxID=695939 RepID=A0A1W1UUM6_9DEIO|nr:hypothetical protein SAMN00790413_05121 [Deinococcus hopiensis KR-140]